MDAPILAYFKDFIEGERLSDEYGEFKRLLESHRRDHGKKFDKEEKIIFFFQEIRAKDGIMEIDPTLDSIPISFSERIKRQIREEEIKAKNKIQSDFEKREREEDRNSYLNYLYRECVLLINSFKQIPAKSDINDHPQIIESLRQIKKFIFTLTKQTVPYTQIAEFVDEFSVRTKYPRDTIFSYLIIWYELRGTTYPRADAKGKLEDLEIEYPPNDATLFNWEDKLIKFLDARTEK